MDPRIQRFRAMVGANVARCFRLLDMARMLSMSPHPSNRCKAETGPAAQGCVEAQKMREASRLLIYTAMTAQRIACQLGFDDPSRFGWVFQRNFHVLPSAYGHRFHA